MMQKTLIYVKVNISQVINIKKISKSQLNLIPTVVLKQSVSYKNASKRNR